MQPQNRLLTRASDWCCVVAWRAGGTVSEFPFLSQHVGRSTRASRRPANLTFFSSRAHGSMSAFEATLSLTCLDSRVRQSQQRTQVLGPSTGHADGPWRYTTLIGRRHVHYPHHDYLRRARFGARWMCDASLQIRSCLVVCDARALPLAAQQLQLIIHRAKL